MTDEQLWRMSDEDLEKAFNEARSQGYSIDDVEENSENDEIQIHDLEQPTYEDSDNDLDTDEISNEESDEASTSTDDSLDGDTAELEEQTEDDNEDEIEEVQEHQTYTFKANGKEFSFTPEEMMQQFPRIFGQAMDYTKKTQALKPWRKTIDALESANLSHDQINLMIDVFKGDKNAIAEVMKRTGTDALELDTENSRYIPNDYGRDETALAIKDVVDEISYDKEYNITQKILTNDWDADSFNEFKRDPNLIKLLHIDVKSGTYDKVQPIAEKLKVFDTGTKKSDLEYYKLAAKEYDMQRTEGERRARAIEEQRLAREQKLARQNELLRVKETQQKQQASVEKAQVRRAAAPTKSKAGPMKVTNYLDGSDEDYEEWYKNNVTNKY